MAERKLYRKRNTLRFLLICLTVAVVLSAAVIFLSREIFALGSDKRTGEGSEIIFERDFSVSEAAKALKRNGIIGSENFFRLYAAIRQKNGGFAAGKYVISPSFGYDGILFRLRGGGSGKRTQLSVIVPEGSTVRDILRIICDENRICSREEMEKEIREGDFSEYSFIREHDSSPRASERIYRLEGYLYPDTYYFYSDSSAHTVLDRMLSNFDRHFDEKYKKACEKNGLTADEAVTLASMIIKEAKFVSDYPKVSSVFKNRRASRVFDGRYQSDATLTYALGRPMKGGDKDDLSPYNTYKYKGLPPGAICNPDMEAISYALYPEKTSYYYFYSLSDGSVKYATTYEEHRRNISRAMQKSETKGSDQIK